MTGEEVLQLEERFEVFKQTCIHPALFWSGKMAEAVRSLEGVTLDSCFVGIYLERLFYYESRYTDEIIKRVK